MKVWFSISLLFLSQLLVGQNLVPNPSFEQFDTCPQYASMINYATPWFNPTWGSSDYYNSCFTYSNPWGSNMDVPNNFIGQEFAKTGEGYAGLFLAYPWSEEPPWNWEFREYIETELLTPLQSEVKYYVSFFVSLADSSKYFTNVAGIYFSNDSLISDTSYRLHYTPQISNPIENYLNSTNGWMKIEGTYIAQGGEKYITIGNFLNNLSTDTIISPYGSNSSCCDYESAYYYLDDVCVSSDSLTCYNFSTGIQTNQKKNEVTFYPNPTFGEITIRFDEFKKAPFIKIRNNLGQLVFAKQYYNSQQIDFDLDFPNGVYFLQIESEGEIISKKIIKQ